MNPREEGFLLLCSHLGFPARSVLTGPQLRVLTNRVRQASCQDGDRELRAQDLVKLGYDREQADRILSLLSEEKLLRQYVNAGEKAGCVSVTLVSPDYPRLVKSRLGADSPGCLWAKGALELLNQPAIAVVGSREPKQAACEFAQAAGRAIAQQGYVLVSGNAQGVDSIAQEACLANGGRVISVVADRLYDKQPDERLLYISEDSFDMAFSPARALSRNRLIHCLGQKTLTVQCRVGKGGTWNGSANNLKKRWSPLFCFDDGTEGAYELERLGARLINLRDLQDLAALESNQQNFFE